MTTTTTTAITPQMATMMTVCGYGVCLFMGLLCAMLLWFMWSGTIDMKSLIAEANGQASMSRFQLLIFTLVVAICMFILIERGSTYAFPEISNGVLTLLGISASTYAVGKAISYSRPEGVTTTRDKQEVHETARVLSKSGASSDVTATETKSTGATNT